MQHLESAFNGKNHPWRYIVMIVAVFLVSNTIGAIPLYIVYFSAIIGDPAIAGTIAENPSDLSLLNMDPFTSLIILLIPFAVALAAFVMLMKPIHFRTFKSVINGTGNIRWNRYFLSFGVWIAISLLYFLMYLRTEPQNFTLNNQTISLLFISIIAVLLIPFQAGLEEVLFRGYLMQGFGILSRNRWIPVVMTSILFGLLHSFNPEVREYGFFAMMPQYVIFGMIFGVAAILDDGIETSMGAHAANNIFLVIMVTHESSALQTPALYRQNEVFPWTELAGLVVSGILFLFIMKLILKWRTDVIISEVNPVPAEPADNNNEAQTL